MEVEEDALVKLHAYICETSLSQPDAPLGEDAHQKWIHPI